MNIIREMIEETEIGRLRLKYAERVRQAYNEGYEDALLTTADTLEGGIGVGHSIVESPASSLRRTTSALLTNIKHRYDADDVCIDCGYDDGEKFKDIDYMKCDDVTHDYGRADICITCLVDVVRKESYAQKTNPTRMMLRSAERKGYENALRDAVEAVKAAMPDEDEGWEKSIAIGWMRHSVAVIEALGGE